MPRRVFYYFSLGEIVNGQVFEIKGNELFQTELNIVANPKQYLTEPYDQFSTFYSVNQDEVYYERNYGGIKCAMLVKGMRSNEIQVYANPSYMRLVKFKIDNMYPVGVHLTDLLLLRILQNDDLVVHGASLQNTKTGKGFLLVAPPDTGKTYTTFHLLKQGYKFLGEDLSYYRSSTDELLCMPYTSTWGHRFSFSKLDPSKIPFVGLFSESNKKGVEEIFGKDAIAEKAELDTIYLIQKGERDRVTEISAGDDMHRRIMAIQRNEFSYFKNSLIRAYEYYNDINVDRIAEKESENFKKLLGKKKLVLVEGTSYESFKGLIDERERS
jgi:hypothetical protein